MPFYSYSLFYDYMHSTLRNQKDLIGFKSDERVYIPLFLAKVNDKIDNITTTVLFVIMCAARNSRYVRLSEFRISKMSNIAEYCISLGRHKRMNQKGRCKY